ncbi:DUF2306 domain-containing protein [Paenibacillus sp. GP183]|jgi:hypothetical protein|uniref:DUF2306 domain-containing protein n=1 Tax=Paenibacillus sp. GP183 TaxID=1882751 RepID=UPI000896F33C|nr:DUF2306 domain-containing protein [Paenibacillus sp. GP183]SEC49901.1 hypothetical protein SAMN05443246_4311 [Paenibacillus sp. GP183]
MNLYALLLIIHIVAGTICLLCGALAASFRKRKGAHTVSGEIYHASYVVVFVTAVAMALMKWSELAFLFYIALFSYGLALYGYLARKRLWPNWLQHHIGGMLGSYIGVITAVLVVNGHTVSAETGIPNLLLWFLPTIIGTPIIRMVSARYYRRGR